ncbi:MAG: Penicillin-insensitive murein endopeptidase [Roseomonas sp.]|nr:Penicillin-insensitive murein endopeptidase [Roseomonas sp.]
MSRTRFWAHPAMPRVVRGLASLARGAGLPPLWAGNLGQARGGPLPWGHASRLLVQAALPRWTDRCGPACAGIRNRCLGTALGIPAYAH